MVFPENITSHMNQQVWKKQSTVIFSYQKYCLTLYIVFLITGKIKNTGSGVKDNCSISAEYMKCLGVAEKTQEVILN